MTPLHLTRLMMRSIALLILAVLIIQGCSRTTAFDFFKMDTEHERAVENMKTGTIVRSFETEAILSTIYLNRVYPDKYKNGEHFFVALYSREDIRLYFKQGLNNNKYNFTCNGEKPIEARELKPGDELRRLMPINNEWNRYYYVSFPKQKIDTLDLVLESGLEEKVTITYHIDED